MILEPQKGCKIFFSQFADALNFIQKVGTYFRTFKRLEFVLPMSQMQLYAHRQTNWGMQVVRYPPKVDAPFGNSAIFSYHSVNPAIA